VDVPGQAYFYGCLGLLYNKNSWSEPILFRQKVKFFFFFFFLLVLRLRQELCTNFEKTLSLGSTLDYL
jgi:hypothetical protein